MRQTSRHLRSAASRRLRVEPLESRRLLAASGLYPVVDLNGPAVGVSYEVSLENTDPAPLGLPDAIDISAATDDLQAVHILPRADVGFSFEPVDTSGTNIEWSYDAGAPALMLTGLDSVENYETVLNRLRVDTDFFVTVMPSIQVYAIDSDGRQGPPSFRISTLNLALPVVQLGPATPDGSLPVFPVGSTDIPVPGAAGITIDAAGRSTLDGGIISSQDGTVTVDLQGTNIIRATGPPGLVVLRGIDTIANYESVLRTARYTPLAGLPPRRHSVVFDIPVEGPFAPVPTVSNMWFVEAVATVDLNGDAAGDGYAADFVLGGPAIPIVDPHGLMIDYTGTHLDFAEVEIDGPIGVFINADTSGTAISAVQQADRFHLFGTDTVANYQRVLRSLVLTSATGQPGQTIQLRLGVGIYSSLPAEQPRATSSIRLVEPLPPPILDLNGDTPGEDYVSDYDLDGPAAPLVDPSGLAIRASEPLLTGARILPAFEAAEITVDTTGTNIIAELRDDGVYLSGADTPENYQQVLRTATIDIADELGGRTVHVETILTGPAGDLASAVSIFTVIRSVLPQPFVESNLYEVTYYRDFAPTPIIPEEFSLGLPPGTLLDGVRVELSPVLATATTVSVSGNISLTSTLTEAFFSGADTVEKYEMVFRTGRLWGGQLHRITLGTTSDTRFFVQQDGEEYLAATLRVTVLEALPAAIDLDSTRPGRNHAAYVAADEAVGHLFSSLTIDSSYRVDEVEITSLDGSPVTLTFDEPQSGLFVTPLATGVRISNDVEPTEKIEALLRTLRVSLPHDPLGQTVTLQFRMKSWQVPDPNPAAPATSAITVLPPSPPVLDINGEADGSLQEVIYFGPIVYGTFGPYETPPVALAPDLSVFSAQMLTSAEVYFPGGLPVEFYYDTSGTGITVTHTASALDFSGTDSVANYQRVLRGLSARLFKPYGEVVPFEIVVHSAAGASSSVTSVVELVWPPEAIVDLNGPAPGTNGKTAFFAGQSNLLLFSDELTIETPLNMPVSHAEVSLYHAGPVDFFVDTSDTNIVVEQSYLQLVLHGVDTTENYERVLRSVQILDTRFLTSQSYRVDVRLDLSQHATSQLLTILPLPLPRADISGDAQQEHFETHYVLGQSATAIVDPAGTTILAHGYEMLQRIDVRTSDGAGSLLVDTNGTSIMAVWLTSSDLVLSGQASVAEYEQVLRSLKFYADAPEDAGTRRIAIAITDATGRRDVWTESLIHVESRTLIVGRHLFYNNSRFDGHTPLADVRDDAAIAPDKSPYFAGSGVAPVSSVSSYVHGINGLMIDVVNAQTLFGLEDFSFRFGHSGPPSQWESAAAPSQIVVRPGAGAGGSDRIVLIWPDGALQNQWLEVTIRGNDAQGGFHTASGLPASDVFYFGSRVGDTFVGTASLAVLTNAADEIFVRQNSGYSGTLTNAYDFNKDGLVNAADMIIARNNVGLTFRINVPHAAASVATPAAAAGISSATEVPLSRDALTAALASRWESWSGERAIEVVTSRPDRPATLVTDRSDDERRARSLWQAAETAIIQVDDWRDFDLSFSELVHEGAGSER